MGAAELCVANLPGRGGRRSESLFTRLEPLVEAISEAIAPWLDRPFAFFGHSMGALISFELARRLRADHGLLPCHLFLSARSAPQLPVLQSPIHGLPDSAFIEELRHFNGTPAQILDEPEILELMIPVLRADFAVCETYRYRREEALNCAMTVFGGDRDRWSSKEALEAWQIHVSGEFKLHMFPGDHFYMNTVRDSLLDRVNEDILLKDKILTCPERQE